MRADDRDAPQPCGLRGCDAGLRVLERDDFGRRCAQELGRQHVAGRIGLPVLDVVCGDQDGDVAVEPGAREHGLDLASERAGHHPHRNAGRRLRDRVAHGGPDGLPTAAPPEVAVDPLLDDVLERFAVDVEPGADDDLLGEARERPVVVVGGERPAVLREQLLVDGQEHRLVVRKRPVEVEGDGSDGAHRAVQPTAASGRGMLRPTGLLAIDQGTTGTTCLVVDDELRAVGRGYRELRQHFPHPGWVEHDPDEIWDSVLAAARDALDGARITPSELSAVGITNQRETTVVWERRTGEPVGHAIVWQDRRTAERCAELPFDLIRARTGLVPDPYFSATKLEWILQRETRPQQELAFGTVDTWLVWNLTEGGAHVTDVTNASRTLLLGLDTLDWDDDLLALFGVERELLPRVVASSGVVGEARLFGTTLPIAGIAGDQQAALFGQGCFSPGDAKATYGTGSFVLVNAGGSDAAPPHGLLRTAAAVAPGAAPQFALEGAVLVGGAAVQWLRDGLGLIADAGEAEA